MSPGYICPDDKFLHIKQSLSSIYNKPFSDTTSHVIVYCSGIATKSIPRVSFPASSLWCCRNFCSLCISLALIASAGSLEQSLNQTAQNSWVSGYSFNSEIPFFFKWETNRKIASRQSLGPNLGFDWLLRGSFAMVTSTLQQRHF